MSHGAPPGPGAPQAEAARDLINAADRGDLRLGDTTDGEESSQ